MVTGGAQIVSTTARLWGGILAGLALVMVGGWCPWRLGVVSGHSMEPTLRPGTFFLYDRSYYRNHSPRPGDVVVVRHAGEVWVKRVYAVGGERFWAVRTLAEGSIAYNPVRQEQRQRFEEMFSPRRPLVGDASRFVRLRLPRDTVFLVGDGSRSWDSRHFGPVDTGELLGRVVTPAVGRLPVWPAWVEWRFPTPNPKAPAPDAASAAATGEAAI